MPLRKSPITAADHITIPLDQVSDVISTSVAAVLRAHGFTFASTAFPGPHGPATLSPATVGVILREIGRNAAQCLVALAEDPGPQGIEAADPTIEPMHPWCRKCGWRRGGRDSWNGSACKCGHSEPAYQHCSTCKGIGTLVSGLCPDCDGSGHVGPISRST